MIQSTERTLIEDFLIYGLDDWIHVSAVAGNIVRRVVEDAEDRRAVAIGLMASAVCRGLVQAGEIVDGKFAPWALDPDRAVAHITDQWMKIEAGEERPGDVVWLCNTEAGDALAQNALARSAQQ